MITNLRHKVFFIITLCIPFVAFEIFFQMLAGVVWILILINYT